MTEPDVTGPGDSEATVTRRRPSTASRAAWLALLLFGTWLLWSGLFKPLLIGLGIVSTALTVYVAKRMGFFDTDLYAFRVSVRLIGYVGWLGKEVVRSSFDVARLVLTPSLPISPTVVEIEAQSSDPVDQVILGNSITLTPGTLALDVHNGRVLVHALTRAGADEVSAGEMNARVTRMRAE